MDALALDQPRMSTAAMPAAAIAVVLPCLNEAAAIAGVIAEFRAALPSAEIFVIDNASTDATAEVARSAGAHVLHEASRGKGHAVRRAFASIDADVYVIADGDGTYDAAAAPALIGKLVDERLDMVVGSRRKIADDAYRAGHEWGNRLFNNLLKSLFGSAFRDIFSGYRILSGRFVKSFPAMSDGFEIETEMATHAVLLRLPVAEVDCDYKGRAAGTHSKLNKYRDGWRILRTIGKLVRLHRPLFYFASLAGLLLGMSLALFVPILLHFLETGLVPRLPTLIVSVAMAIVGALLAMCGIILDSTIRTQLEIRRLLYLNAGGSQRGPARRS